MLPSIVNSTQDAEEPGDVSEIFLSNVPCFKKIISTDKNTVWLKFDKNDIGYENATEDENT